MARRRAAQVMTRFENTDPAIVYTPGSPSGPPPAWWHGSRSRGWSAETASFNRSDGARAALTFTGTSVTWIGFRASWAGIGRVYVDGAFAGEIDLYSPTEQPQSRVFTASGLAPGTHTFAVRIDRPDEPERAGQRGRGRCLRRRSGGGADAARDAHRGDVVCRGVRTRVGAFKPAGPGAPELRRQPRPRGPVRR